MSFAIFGAASPQLDTHLSVVLMPELMGLYRVLVDFDKISAYIKTFVPGEIKFNLRQDRHGYGTVLDIGIEIRFPRSWCEPEDNQISWSILETKASESLKRVEDIMQPVYCWFYRHRGEGLVSPYSLDELVIMFKNPLHMQTFKRYSKREQ